MRHITIAVRQQPAVLFPDEYCWFVFVASLDIMLTWLILGLGGLEVNPLAATILLTSGFWGMIVFKFAMTALVIVICEEVGRRGHLEGQRLARIAVAISAIPAVWSLTQVGAAYL